MKDFRNFGLKIRENKEQNYKAIWCNLKTIRVGEGKCGTLPIDEKEFLDVAINTKCNACCDFCYVSANKLGINYPNICETWKKWMDNYFWERVENHITYTNKVFQIAVGSTGEPTIHPNFAKFLQTVYETNVVPNYTTNGIIFGKKTKQSEEIMEATRNFVGGVAISFGNKSIREYAEAAVTNLLRFGNTNINIHHIISDKDSVDEFVTEQLRYGDDILYHVLLPLMPEGRSDKGIEEGVWEYLEEVIDKNNIKNVAFGANFIKNLQSSKIKTWLYDEHSLSANCLLKPDGIVLTKSSFDLTPVKIIKV